MALGLLLRVSWICFLLFNVTAALPAIKGYGYPHTADTRNMVDNGDDGDGENEEVTLPTFNQSNWQASNNQQIGPVYTSYDKPTVAQQPLWVLPPQNLPYTRTAPEVDRPVNGAPKDWGLDKLPSLPQPSAPAKPQPAPVKPQSTSLASTNRMPASPSAGDSPYSIPPPYYEPALPSTSEAAKSPNFDTWQPGPVSSGSAVADFNTGSNAAGGGLSNTPHLVYEDVFQYPSENTGSSIHYGADSSSAGRYGQADNMSKGSSIRNAPILPSNPTVGAQPVHLSRPGSTSSGLSRDVNLYSSQTDYRPHDEISWQPQEPVASNQEVAVSQRVSERLYPHMFQSRNGYRLGNYRFVQTRYTPDYPTAAPKGIRKPPRTKW